MRTLKYLIDTNYLKMMATVKEQLMWLVYKLSENSVTGTDQICISILRQIRVGDLSQMNLWLCDMFIKQVLRNMQVLSLVFLSRSV